MAHLLTIFGLGLVIFLHELGHLLVARSTGLPVTRFSIGMGPVIFSRRAWGLEWALSAVPFAAYVMFDGESEAYEKAEPWRKILTMLAGPAANFLVAIVLYIVAASISAHELAIGAGIQKGLHSMDQLFSALGLIFSGKVGIKDLGGPVMMVTAGASLAGNPASFVAYLGFLSMNLAVINMLPIPALDGGQILVTLTSAISGRESTERVLQWVVRGSFVLLIGLIGWITLQDVVRLL